MEITIHYEEDDKRPKKGWRIYEHGFGGLLMPCKSQRRNRIKYRLLHDALKWASENKKDHSVNIRVKCFSGILRSEGSYKKLES